MPFGVKNEPPTFQKVMIETFRKHFNNFMKIFLNDFTIYNNMETFLQKFKLCF